jgi:hypothetical protein
VAAAIVTFWRRKQLRTSAAPAAVPSSAPSTSGTAQSKRSKQREARAS